MIKNNKTILHIYMLTNLFISKNMKIKCENKVKHKGLNNKITRTSEL